MKATLYLTPGGWCAQAVVRNISWTTCRASTEDNAVKALERLCGAKFDERQVVEAPKVDYVLDRGPVQKRLM